MHSAILTAYQESQQRLFLLDYDGTLIELKPTPPEALPTLQISDVLQKLGSDPDNTIVIISGRDRQTLETWLGKLPVTLIAEHGSFLKEAGKPWQQVAEVDETWKPTIRQTMQASVDKVPGSFIEDKTISLVWHYRTAESHAGTAEAEKLQRNLIQPAASLGLQVLPGSKIVEVRQRGSDKGLAAQRWLTKASWDFILAAGDDTTDEDLFRALPAEAFAIKIGTGATHAQDRLASPAVFMNFLQQLI